MPEGLEGHGAKYLCPADCCGTVAPLGVAEVAVTVDNATVSGVDCDKTLDLLGSDPINERVKGRSNYVLLTMLLVTCKDKLG